MMRGGAPLPFFSLAVYFKYWHCDCARLFFSGTLFYLTRTYLVYLIQCELCSGCLRASEYVRLRKELVPIPIHLTSRGILKMHLFCNNLSMRSSISCNLNNGKPSPFLLGYSYNKKPSNNSRDFITHTSLIIHDVIDLRQ